MSCRLATAGRAGVAWVSIGGGGGHWTSPSLGTAAGSNSSEGVTCLSTMRHSCALLLCSAHMGQMVESWIGGYTDAATGYSTLTSELVEGSAILAPEIGRNGARPPSGGGAKNCAASPGCRGGDRVGAVVSCDDGGDGEEGAELEGIGASPWSGPFIAALCMVVAAGDATTAGLAVVEAPVLSGSALGVFDAERSVPLVSGASTGAGVAADGNGRRMGSNGVGGGSTAPFIIPAVTVAMRSATSFRDALALSCSIICSRDFSHRFLLRCFTLATSSASNVASSALDPGFEELSSLGARNESSSPSSCSSSFLATVIGIAVLSASDVESAAAVPVPQATGSSFTKWSDASEESCQACPALERAASGMQAQRTYRAARVVAILALRVDAEARVNEVGHLHQVAVQQALVPGTFLE